jgi:hypothetical protein
LVKVIVVGAVYPEIVRPNDPVEVPAGDGLVCDEVFEDSVQDEATQEAPVYPLDVYDAGLVCAVPELQL